MQGSIILIAKIGLLVLLWFFILMTIRALNRDLKAALPPDSPLGAGGQAPVAPRRRGFRKPAPRQLVIVSGPLTGSSLELDGYSEITIGRSSQSTLVLEDDYASGSHARFIHRNGRWFLEDLDSRNGTFLNNQRIDQPEIISVGHDVRIGQTVVRIEA